MEVFALSVGGRGAHYTAKAGPNAPAFSPVNRFFVFRSLRPFHRPLRPPQKAAHRGDPVDVHGTQTPHDPTPPGGCTAEAGPIGTPTGGGGDQHGEPHVPAARSPWAGRRRRARSMMAKMTKESDQLDGDGRCLRGSWNSPIPKSRGKGQEHLQRPMEARPAREAQHVLPALLVTPRPHALAHHRHQARRWRCPRHGGSWRVVAHGLAADDRRAKEPPPWTSNLADLETMPFSRPLAPHRRMPGPSPGGTAGSAAGAAAPGRPLAEEQRITKAAANRERRWRWGHPPPRPPGRR